MLWASFPLCIREKTFFCRPNKLTLLRSAIQANYNRAVKRAHIEHQQSSVVASFPGHTAGGGGGERPGTRLSSVVAAT